jgi:hypothetical protein
MTTPPLTEQKTFKKLSKKLNTPSKVQKFLSTLTYNYKPTMRSAYSTWKAHEAHCLEAAFLAAAILEPLGYPPLVVSFESVDLLEHVIFVYKKNGLWGSCGFSRDQGLKGRRPIFRSIRSLTLSYFDPYVDKTGKITAYQLASLDDSKSDWRYSKKNVWKAETYLLDIAHHKLPSSKNRVRKLRESYIKNGPMKPKSFWTY